MPRKATRRHRPIQDRAKQTKAHISRTAASLFGERGIEATSMNRIATQAGVGIGTVYRYFPDRAALVDDLLESLLQNIEETVTQRVFEVAQLSPGELFTAILGAASDELMNNVELIRALTAFVQFHDSGLSEFERRLRLLIKVAVIQILGPGDDHTYDIMCIVLINTGFAAVLRSATLEIADRKRAEILTITARAMAEWIEAERRARVDGSSLDVRAQPSAPNGRQWTAPRVSSVDHITEQERPVPKAAVDGRRVPRQERAMLTREHILDTAAQLFTERGIANTSTNRIAAEAGVSIGTVYRYFADRTVIVQELIQRLMTSGEKHFRQSVLDRDGETILEVATIALEVMTDEIMRNAGLVRALVAGAQFYSSGISEFEPRLLEVGTNLVSHAFGDGDELVHDAMATAMVNTTFAAVLRAATLDSDSGDHREVARMTARLIAAAAQAELTARNPPVR